MSKEVWDAQGAPKFNFLSGELNICLVVMFFYYFQGWADIENILRLIIIILLQIYIML